MAAAAAASASEERADRAGSFEADLSDLVQWLRASGFRIGVDQALAAQDLLVVLAGGGGLPDDEARLRTLLAPIFCRTPAEQAEFYHHFSDWTKRRDATATGREVPSSSLSDAERDVRRL